MNLRINGFLTIFEYQKFKILNFRILKTTLFKKARVFRYLRLSKFFYSPFCLQTLAINYEDFNPSRLGSVWIENAWMEFSEQKPNKAIQSCRSQALNAEFKSFRIDQSFQFLENFRLSVSKRCTTRICAQTASIHSENKISSCQLRRSSFRCFNFANNCCRISLTFNYRSTSIPQIHRCHQVTRTGINCNPPDDV